MGEGTRTPDIQSHSLTTPVPKVQADNELRADDPAACRPACRIDPEDPDLARVAAAWPELPPHIKAAILAMIGSASVPPSDDVGKM